MLSTDAAMNTPELIEWKRKYALRYAMQKWVTENDCDVLDMCVPRAICRARALRPFLIIW
jgi:hypothetical protein